MKGGIQKLWEKEKEKLQKVASLWMRWWHLETI